VPASAAFEETEMTILLHVLVYVPATMALGAYVWVKQDMLKVVVSGWLGKMRR